MIAYWQPVAVGTKLIVHPEVAFVYIGNRVYTAESQCTINTKDEGQARRYDSYQAHTAKILHVHAWN